jgi:hypothetical protein
VTSQVTVDRDFPGGNIFVESIGESVIRVHQELRDTNIDWFYWCFRVRGAQKKTLRFVFTMSHAIGVRGPAFSLDEGHTWTWLGVSSEGASDESSDEADSGDKENSFEYTFAEDAASVRFSFAMPYQVEHWNAFTETLPVSDLLALHTLCTTPKGRVAPYVRLGCLSGKPSARVAITCRHHCCEMMVNYAVEGLIRWVLEDGGDDAAWIRHNVEILIVPFVDIDGVEDGDQGKCRVPRDHGRDYSDDSLYSTTAVIRELLSTWVDGSPLVAVDLHCPHISGEHNEVIYLVGRNDEVLAEQERLFSGILEAHRTGLLPFEADNYLPYGQAWNIADNNTLGKGFTRWAAELDTILLASAIELPYANASGVVVDQHSACEFGVDLGRALSAYLVGRL